MNRAGSNFKILKKNKVKKVFKTNRPEAGAAPPQGTR